MKELAEHRQIVHTVSVYLKKTNKINIFFFTQIQSDNFKEGNSIAS